MAGPLSLLIILSAGVAKASAVLVVNVTAAVPVYRRGGEGELGALWVDSSSTWSWLAPIEMPDTELSSAATLTLICANQGYICRPVEANVDDMAHF